MEASFNMETQSYIEENVEKHVVVELIDSGEGQDSMSEIGLFRISCDKKLRRNDKKLMEDFRTWIPMPGQINKRRNESKYPVQAESVKFNITAECIEHLETCGRQRVVLILSGSHAQNKTLVSEFKRLPQIAMIYRHLSQEQFHQWSERWSVDSLFSGRNKLSRKIIGTPVQNLDEASRLRLIEILSNEFIVNLPSTEEAKQDFIDFCRSTYKDNAICLRQIEDFQNNYSEGKAMKWYTKSNNFVFYIVGQTCSTFNFTNYFNIRFILHDLYLELKNLHDEQSSMWPESFLVVYRGKSMAQKELSRLPKMGELFVTRGFLSCTTDYEIAELFSGEDQGSNDQVNVIISMWIDREEVTSKPIAFMKGESSFGDEEEVILPMGIVFRTVSYEEIDNGNSACLVRITMVRSKIEQ
ncbi:unnamed protein product [Adineta steineri]|uniref:NAD(P)(+)--arginine ADP-ribosyltransferase n=1 Tax=Adineta steineri TaxID=433720 RepID=A0A813X0P0_9BILA|nr:unnamed protein product [Adineta steineri]CAF3618666.1 unnamed protein product [Adineta steineri]